VPSLFNVLQCNPYNDSNLLGAFPKYITINLISFIFLGEITVIIIRAKYLKIMLRNAI